MKKNRHTPVFRFVVATLCSVVLAACAMGSARHFTVQMLDDFPLITRVAEVEDVPFIAQEDKYCGPAALAMVSSWLSRPLTQEDAAAMVYTPKRQGTLQNDMLAATRRLGFMAVENTDPQTAFLQVSQGRPVVVFLNLGLGIYPVWHYAVLKGYNLDNRTVTLHSGINENEVMPLETFLRTWKRTGYWSLFATRPDDIPMGVKPLDVQKTILGFEQVQAFDSADIAYNTALARWPKDFVLRMGYANMLYTQKDYKAAEQQFLQVWEYYPKAHAPLNNLAYALIEQTCYNNAIHAAREALWLAPEKDKPSVQKTLDAALTHHGKRESLTCTKKPVIR